MSGLLFFAPAMLPAFLGRMRWGRAALLHRRCSLRHRRAIPAKRVERSCVFGYLISGDSAVCIRRIRE
ncbi:hypothetical protein NRY95_11860 [Xanthomonas campestris pv. phormiicola]|nr:hypothetical protein [Xanthomonas campestris pv. phormiicola]UYC14451.1 hypothetical protein NRY95_11860 [Xanthomonas campestris pv. phormiicola]